MQFEDDSLDSVKIVKQWNVKIISVRNFFLKLYYFHVSLVQLLVETSILPLFYPLHFSFFIFSPYAPIMQISKNKRHQDRAAALEVWDRLEEFVQGQSHS